MGDNLRATLLWLALALVAVPFGLLLQQVRADGPVARFDAEAVAEINDWARHGGPVVEVARQATRLGGSGVLVPVVVGVALGLLWRQRARAATFLLVTVVGGSLLSSVVKALVDRDRPDVALPLDDVANASFPSGHALNATVAWGALLAVLLPMVPPTARRAAVVAAVVLVATVGATRIVLGVHYPSDVLAGHVLGAAWLAVSMAAFESAVLSATPRPWRSPPS